MVTEQVQDIAIWILIITQYSLLYIIIRQRRKEREGVIKMRLDHIKDLRVQLEQIQQIKKEIEK